jgi:DNA repair protein RadC
MDSNNNFDSFIENLTFDEKFKTNLNIHIKCLMNSADFKIIGMIDSEKIINFFKKNKLYTYLGLKNPIYASAVSLFMHLMFYKDLDTLILNKTKYSKLLSINDDTFSKYYNNYCKRISLNINEFKNKIFQYFEDLLNKLSINFNISLSEEFKIELKNRAKELYEYFNKFEISKFDINDIIYKGDYNLYHPKYIGAILIHFFKDEFELTYKVRSGNQVTYASLNNLRALLGIGSTQRLLSLYENRVVIAEKYLKRRLKNRKILDEEILSFLKKNKNKEEVNLVNILLKCSNLNLRKLLKITGMFEGKVNVALDNLSEINYYFKSQTLENNIFPFIQSIKDNDKSEVALVGYKDYLDYYNEEIRKTSEKARRRNMEVKEKYGNNYKSIEVRILRFLQTLGFSFDDYDLVSHLRDLNYISTENTAIFHHSDMVKENDEIFNFLFLPKKRKVDRGKDVSYTYHTHASVHAEEGKNIIKKFLRILCNSTKNNDSEILNDLQFLNWNQDSIELAKSRLCDFDWVHNIYEYLPKYGDWKKINFKKLNKLVEKYLHPNFKKSLKIIKQDFEKSWERYLKKKKEYREEKYENISPKIISSVMDLDATNFIPYCNNLIDKNNKCSCKKPRFKKDKIK